MGRYIQWITHRSKPILFVNCAGLKEPEYLAALEEMKQELLKQAGGALCLLDITEAPGATGTAANAKAREVAAAIKAKGIPEKPTAMVGLNRIQRTIAEMIGYMLARGGKYYFADTLESAKEWLVKQTSA